MIKTMILIVVGVLLFSQWVIGASEQHIENTNNDHTTTDSYTHHPVIRINSNEDFASQAAVEGWAGNGSASAPYIISGYNIDAHGANNAIYIGNTTVHFIIENCSLYNTSYYTWTTYAGHGLMLYNVTNATIKNTKIFNAEENGVDIIQGQHIIMENVSVNKTGDDGIYLLNSQYDTIENSIVSNSTYIGIELFSSSNITIISNLLYNNTMFGIGIYYSHNNTVRDNVMLKRTIFMNGDKKTFTTQTIDNNTADGKPIYYYKNINKNNATAPTNAGEIILGNVSYFNIENLRVDNVSIVIEEGYSSHVSISNITANFASMGIALVNSNNNAIRYIKFSRVGYSGVTIRNSNNNTLNNLTLERSYYYGIHIYNSSSNTISNSTVGPCTQTAILVEQSNFTHITNTSVTDGGHGLIISSSYYASLYNNSFVNSGIYLEGPRKTFTTQSMVNNKVNGKNIYYLKNINMNGVTTPSNAGEVILGNVSYLNVTNLNLSNIDYGMEIGYSSHIPISNLTVNHNKEDGIYITNSNNITIRSSNISNNGYEGIYIHNSVEIHIKKCIIGNGNVGIELDRTNDSTIEDNLIYQNFWTGIIIDCCSHSNEIYNNSFYYNARSGEKFSSSHIQVLDYGYDNHWNSSTGYGNYWCDWANNNTTNDQNHDGIVDWPYQINKWIDIYDHYPLKNATYPMPALRPSAPTHLTAVVGSGFVNLSWGYPLGNGSSPLIEYRIYRNYTLYATVPATQMWYNDTNVTPGVEYTYYVIAVNSIGMSSESNSVDATPTSEVPEFNSEIIWIAIITAILAMLSRRKHR